MNKNAKNEVIKVLLIEDDPADVKIIDRLLKKSCLKSQAFCELELIHADNFKSGVDLIEKGGINVVLLDLSLPDSSGMETIDKINDKAPNLPIIILTGHDDEEFAAQAVSKGIQDYLLKGSFDGALLRQSINYSIERFRLIMQLEKSCEKNFTNIIEKNADGMLVVGKDRIVYFVNPAAETIFGRTKEELIGKSFEFPIIVGETTELSTTRQGEMITAEMRMSEIEWEKKPAYLASIRDITELKKKEVELSGAKKIAEEAAKVKADFLANMSHEIRTPMNSIVGLCALLQKTSLNKTQNEYINVILSSGQLLCSVIDGILDYSKLESGKIVVEVIDFNLHYLVKDTMDMVLMRGYKGNIRTFIDIDKDLPQSFKGDPTKIRQVLLNLISNALKFTEKGEIRVIVNKEKDAPDNGITLRFTVKDTGVGMSKDGMSNIFQPFAQADSSITREYGGTGLGLSIVKYMIEAMGGKIWVNSEEGKGSEFIFVIKLRKSETASKKEICPVKIEDVVGLKVVLVDDSEIARKILKKFCDSLKIKVVATESSGLAVLNKLTKLEEEEDLPALILSDIRMEEMGGLEMAEKIRVNKKYEKIKIIAVSSMAYPGAAKVARSKGFDGYLPKPVNNTELVKVVTTVLGDNRGGGPIVTRHMANELGCRGLKVLIVEDNKPNQMLMQEYAKELEFDSEFVENGQLVIDRLKKGVNYDLILMDLHMPVLGGIEATEIIRKTINKDIPIIALTAAVLEKDRENVKAAGMNDFLTKPIDIDDLREKIIKYGRKI